MPGAATAAGTEFAWTGAWPGGAAAWSTFVRAVSELEPCEPDGEDISTEPVRRTPEAGNGVGVGLAVGVAAAADPARGAAPAAAAAASPGRGSVRPIARLSPLWATA